VKIPNRILKTLKKLGLQQYVSTATGFLEWTRIYSICNLGVVLDSILRRAFEKNRGYPKKVFEIHVVHAGMEPRYRTTSVLSKVPLD
jgi:hypothetical protein